MKYAIAILLALGLAFGGYKGLEFYKLQQEQSQDKEYLAEINKVNYGLFNLQLWKHKALDIFKNNLSGFRFPPSMYQEVEKELMKYMKEIYADYFESGRIVEDFLQKSEDDGKINSFVSGLLSSNLGKALEHFDIESQLPYVARNITYEIRKREPQMKDILTVGLANIVNDISDNPYIDPRKDIYDLLEKNDLKETTIFLNERIQEREQKLNFEVKILYGILLGVALLSLFLSFIIGSRLSILMTSLASIILLILGVLMPMMDIDARLNAFSIKLFDQQMTFDEQVLYYQSKSILDVTKTMIQQGRWDLQLVGFLVLGFSVVVPLIKLCLTGGLVLSDHLRKSKIIKNIVYHLGKWSMADVFVVAMFMAYIGFEGILSTQLGMLERNNTGFAVKTINYSSLSYGALFFTTYCILSIISGIMVKKYDDKMNQA